MLLNICVLYFSIFFVVFSVWSLHVAWFPPTVQTLAGEVKWRLCRCDWLSVNESATSGAPQDKQI